MIQHLVERELIAAEDVNQSQTEKVCVFVRGTLQELYHRDCNTVKLACWGAWLGVSTMAMWRSMVLVCLVGVCGWE
jgi:hypothetical protein